MIAALIPEIWAEACPHTANGGAGRCGRRGGRGRRYGMDNGKQEDHSSWEKASSVAP